MTSLFSSAYWPNLHYMAYALASDIIVIEAHEHYQKQSYRNRCTILSANGPLHLTIPVVAGNSKKVISELQISYTENWQPKHWRAITSAYKNSPFFEYFEDEIRTFYFQRYDTLLTYNTEQLTTLAKILKLKKEILFTKEYNREVTETDLRELIHPKKSFTGDQKISRLLHRPYYQTFGDKFGFVPNLSFLDLLFNEGLQSLNYFPNDTFTL